MSKKNEVEVPVAGPVSPERDPYRALSQDGKTIDWDYLEERLERARLAGLRMGNPPFDLLEPLTDAELAEIAESKRRLRALPPTKAEKSSVELIREMRGEPGPWLGKDEDEGEDEDGL